MSEQAEFVARVVCLHRPGISEPLAILAERKIFPPIDAPEGMSPTSVPLDVRLQALRLAAQRLGQLRKSHWRDGEGRRPLNSGGALRDAIDQGGAYAHNQLRCNACGETWRVSESDMMRIIRHAAATGNGFFPKESAGIVIHIA